MLQGLLGNAGSSYGLERKFPQDLMQDEYNISVGLIIRGIQKKSQAEILKIVKNEDLSAVQLYRVCFT